MPPKGLPSRVPFSLLGTHRATTHHAIMVSSISFPPHCVAGFFVPMRA